MVPDDPDGSALRGTVEELRKENERLRRAEEAGRSDEGDRWKAVVSWVLIVVACLLSVLSVFVVFARNEVLNTDTYVSTVTPLASNPAVQSAVARRVSDASSTRPASRARSSARCPAGPDFSPPRLQQPSRLRWTRSPSGSSSRPNSRKLWVQANRRAHKQLVALLTGSKEGALQSSDGTVTLDLSQLMGTAKQALDERGITLFNKVPTASAPTLTLFQSTQLVRLQGLTRLLNRIYILLPILALLPSPAPSF